MPAGQPASNLPEDTPLHQTRIRVSITGYHMRNVPKDFRVIPGMTMVGDIMVGRRTILSYLVEGALRTGSEAMREP